MLALLSYLPAFAQVSTSRIVGTVTDKTGAVIVGATVIATNEGTNVALTTKTTSAGTYSFESVQVGTYRIAVEMAGFKRFVSTGNVLQIGQATAVNLVLEVGATSEQVEVSGAAEAVQTTTSGNIGNVVDSVSVTRLPIVGSRGRNPIDLVLLQPGVVSGSNTGGGVHVNGARDRAWNYTLDGIDINENSAPGSDFSPLRTNPDMLQEFRVVTGSPTAELGSTSGGQVLMVTKSGGNAFHGDGTFLYQTPSFMANSVNNKIYATPIKRPQWVQKIWNGGIGGPIQKNKTFFFFNIQRLTTLRTTTQTATVYTPTARQGIYRYISKTYAPGCTETGSVNRCPRNTAAGVASSIVDTSGNVLPQYQAFIGSYNVATRDPLALGLDPTTMQIINSVPEPNNYTVGDGLNTAGYTFVAPENEKQLDVTFKVDHNFSERNSAFVRVSWGHQNTIGDLANGGAPMYPDSYPLVNTYRTPRNFAINWRVTPTNSMTNEMVLGMHRFGFNFINGDPHGNENSPLGLNNMTMPTSNWSKNQRTLTTLQWGDNLKWVKGAHTLGFGANVKFTRHIDDRGAVGAYDVNQTVNFSTSTSTGNPVDATLYQRPSDINVYYDWGRLQSSINDMLGKVGAIQQGFVSSKGQWQPGGTLYIFESRFPSYQFYGQDSWKITRKLVLDLGLRWEVYPSPSNPSNTILHPDQAAFAGAPGSNTLKWVEGRLFKSSFGNIGPSVGFAWDPFGQGKTSVRGSFRIAYDPINTFVLSSAIFQGLPGLTFPYNYTDFGQAGGRLRQGLPTIAPPSTKDPLAMRQPVPFSTTSINVMDPNWQPARTNMWSLSIQHELPMKMVFEANYIGRHADHLMAAYNNNQVDVITNGFLNEFNTVASGGESTVINQMLAGDSRLGTNTGSAYLRLNYGSNLTNGDVATIAANLNNRYRTVNGVQTQQIVINGFSPYFFTPNPQFLGGMGVIDSKGWSNYEALQAIVRRRFSNGVQLQFSYTFGKSLDTSSFDPTFTRFAVGNTQTAANTPLNIYDRALNYARSDFDRRHAFQGNFVVELPFGKGRMLFSNVHPALDKIIGGWEVSSIITMETGRPMTAFGSAYTISDQIRTWANCTGCSANMGSPHWEGGDPFAGGTMYFFTPEQRAMFSNPGPGEIGSMGRNSITMSPYKNWDAAISKDLRIIEGHNLRLSIQAQNVTNSVMYGIPYTGLTTSTYFGEMSGPIGIQNTNGARRMQVSAKYSF